MLSPQFCYLGRSSLTRGLQSTLFQNSGGILWTRKTHGGGRKFMCLILDTLLLLYVAYMFLPHLWHKKKLWWVLHVTMRHRLWSWHIQYIHSISVSPSKVNIPYNKKLLNTGWWLCCTGLGHSKLQRMTKLHNWFKSYGNFNEWVDFALWWSCIGKGLQVPCEAGLIYLSSTHLN